MPDSVTPVIEYRSQCPCCPAAVAIRFAPEALRDALQSKKVLLHCHYCESSWQAGPEERKELERKLSGQAWAAVSYFGIAVASDLSQLFQV